jgi:hypothetical protein
VLTWPRAGLITMYQDLTRLAIGRLCTDRRDVVSSQHSTVPFLHRVMPKDQCIGAGFNTQPGQLD